jgi:molybdopterin-biosynthesis enzyme MoeA-like protein
MLNKTATSFFVALLAAGLMWRTPGWADHVKGMMRHTALTTVTTSITVMDHVLHLFGHDESNIEKNNFGHTRDTEQVYVDYEGEYDEDDEDPFKPERPLTDEELAARNKRIQQCAMEIVPAEGDFSIAEMYEFTKQVEKCANKGAVTHNEL